MLNKEPHKQWRSAGLILLSHISALYNSSFTKDALACRVLTECTSKNHWLIQFNSNLILQRLDKNKTSHCSICKSYFSDAKWPSEVRTNYNHTVITFCCTKNVTCTNCFLLSNTRWTDFISLSQENWQNLPFLRKYVYFSFPKHYPVTGVYVTSELFPNFASFFIPL